MAEDVEKLPSRDVETGGAGITGYYDSMMGRIKGNIYNAMLWTILFLWVLTWPFDVAIYRFAPFITVALLVKLFVFCLAVSAWAPFYRALIWLVAWQECERNGMEYVERNNHRFRVIYFRTSDKSLQWDQKTRKDRLDEELKAKSRRIWDRRAALAKLIGPVLVLILLPIAVWLFHPLIDALIAAFWRSNDGVAQWHETANWWWSNAPWIPYAELQREGQEFFGRYGLGFFVVGSWLLFAVFPPLVKYGILKLEESDYQDGYQFIPGAKVLDEVEPELHLGTLEREKIYGAAGFVRPKVAASLLGSDGA